MPEHPTRDGYQLPDLRDTPARGRTDQRYCTPACRQAAYRRRTPFLAPQPSAPPASCTGAFPPRAHRLRMR